MAKAAALGGRLRATKQRRVEEDQARGRSESWHYFLMGVAWRIRGIAWWITSLGSIAWPVSGEQSVDSLNCNRNLIPCRRTFVDSATASESVVYRRGGDVDILDVLGSDMEAGEVGTKSGKNNRIPLQGSLHRHPNPRIPPPTRHFARATLWRSTRSTRFVLDFASYFHHRQSAALLSPRKC